MQTSSRTAAKAAKELITSQVSVYMNTVLYGVKSNMYASFILHDSVDAEKILIVLEIIYIHNGAGIEQIRDGKSAGQCKASETGERRLPRRERRRQGGRSKWAGSTE
jgi:hypothetical protein